MRVLVTGGSGALGRRLLPALREAGHEVVATSRSAAGAERIRALGAAPLELDLFDRDAVRGAVLDVQPDAIVHEATALAGATDYKHFDRTFRTTNRLRTEGTDNLLAAAREADVGRFLAQSYAGWPYARDGVPVKDEDAPLDPDPPAPMRETLAAIRHLERVVPEAGGIVLRYGGFYGDPADVQLAIVRKRQMPVVGDGGGVWSFVHLDDAAAGTVLALERGAPGIYNLVDDEPAPVREWLPVLAEAAGAKRPLHVPLWLGRLLGGEAVVSIMTRVSGASNAKAKRELGWTLSYPSWRTGFAAAYAGGAAPPAGSPDQARGSAQSIS
jgi:nucleoside-diphosphate-sugar epimerase